MNKSKAAIVVSQIIEKIELVLGWAGGALWVLTMVVCIAEPMDSGKGAVVITCLILIAIHVFLIVKGRERKKMRLMFKTYVSQLSIDPTGTIANIASATGQSTDQTKKNLQYMLKHKFFNNAYIDEANDRIVLQSQRTDSYVQTPVNQGTQNVQTEMRTCNCPNCGGVNKIAVGKVAECDFCGSVIGG